MGEMIPKWFKPEDVEKTMGLWRTMLEGKSPVPESLTWITKDGGEVPTIFTVSFIRDAEGNPTTVVVAIKDITELKRAEEALRESEQWLSTTLRSIGDAVIATDAHGIVTLMNTVAEDLTGWDEAEAVGKPLEDVFNIINEKTGQPAENPVAKVLWEGIVVGLANHTVLIARDGTKLHIADSGAPMRDEEGNIIGIVMVFRDITESKRSEEALWESEEKFRSFADQSPNMIFVNSMGGVVYANKKSEELMGYSKEEFYSPDFDFLSLIAPESIEMVKSCFGKHLKGEVVKPYEYTLINREGTRIGAINATGLIKYEGEPAVLGITTDITERKRMEEELVRKEKLASIGQLASGLGHELRNPLGVIGNSAYYLNMKLKDADEKVRKHIEIQQREVNRANKIITDLLDFSRVRPPSLEKCNVNSIIKDTLADLKVPEKVSVETHLNEELPGIIGDPDQIRQVFLNLISNAVQAMSEEGRLDIKTGVKDDFAEIMIRDTGAGIPEEHIQKIFEPLFTKKAKGLGLGLSIVKGIVEGHNGKIEVESKVGEGTTFTLKLPLQRVEERGG